MQNSRFSTHSRCKDKISIVLYNWGQCLGFPSWPRCTIYGIIIDLHMYHKLGKSSIHGAKQKKLKKSQGQPPFGCIKTLQNMGYSLLYLNWWPLAGCLEPSTMLFRNWIRTSDQVSARTSSSMLLHLDACSIILCLRPGNVTLVVAVVWSTCWSTGWTTITSLSNTKGGTCHVSSAGFSVNYPNTHKISKLVVWISHNPASYRVNPLHCKVHWFLGFIHISKSAG